MARARPAAVAAGMLCAALVCFAAPVVGRHEPRGAGVAASGTSVIAGDVGAAGFLGGVTVVGIAGTALSPLRRRTPKREAIRARGANRAGRVTLLETAGALGRATLVDPWSLEVRRYDAVMPDLPRSLEGFRLVQLSDTHLGPHTEMYYLRQVIARALALDPDLYVLTGDYIDRGREHIQRAAALFRPLVERPGRSRGVIGVLGNHDWKGGNAPAVRRALERVGVHLIDNSRVFVCASDRDVLREHPSGEALCIAGVGDLLMDTVDVGAALGDVPESTPRVLLAHNPATALLGEISGGGRRIDLMLSGHTHGRQVRFPFTVRRVPGAGATLRRLFRTGGFVECPCFPVVVSRGVGMSVLPMRLNVPPEIVEVTLRRAGGVHRGDAEVAE